MWRVLERWSREKNSTTWWNGVEVVMWVCGEVGRWPQASNVETVWTWGRWENCTEYRALLGGSAYNAVWIYEYVIVAGLLFRNLQKDAEFQLETEKMKWKAILKEAHCQAQVLRTIDIGNHCDKPVTTIDRLSLSLWWHVAYIVGANPNPQPRDVILYKYSVKYSSSTLTHPSNSMLETTQTENE